MTSKQKTVRLLGVPMDLGAGRRGVDMGPSAIRIAGVSRALERLGKLQLQQKEYEGAQSTYRKILALDPDSVEAKYQIIFLDTLGSGPEAGNK